MQNILGLDLGTNSIGWALRDLNSETDNQIIDYGVVIFKKGVGEGKSGEFSLAAERRKNRSKRRLYNAKRYRKWATLSVLSKNGMCPISEEELRLWSIGKWQNGKNKGRVYPTSPDFKAWLTMDFDRISTHTEVETKLIPAYINPYYLRADLLENNLENDKHQLYKIGRAFYHLTQRRGFKTSRKNGSTSYANNELFKKFKELHPDKSSWKPSQIYLYIQNGKDSNIELRKDRIRNNAVIQRGLNEEEFFAICQKQKIQEDLSSKIHKAIYFVRPLRTQKGLVGKCTLEKTKSRIPISHPVFEEFRALSFINNLKWRERDSEKMFETIPITVKQTILEKIFFRKFEKGKNKGKIDESGSIDFSEIIDAFSEKGKMEFNFKNKLTVSTCPVIAGMMNVFDDLWKDKFILTTDRFGINWNGLKLCYNSIYQNQILKEKKLDYQAIWHLLFDFLQTKDDEAGLSAFCRNILKWDELRTDAFINININQGYGSLSKNAISKILPFLQQGFIYSQAVSFANLTSVLGKDNFEKNKAIVTHSISDTICDIDRTKEKLTIVNGLIQIYFSEATNNKPKGFNGTIEEINFYSNEVKQVIVNYFGESSWNYKNEFDKDDYFKFILDKYLIFLSGKQSKEEKASARVNKNPEIDYYKIPRLDDAIKQVLKSKFNATKEGLKKLYHPSDIDIYPRAKNNLLEDPNPPSKGWKNPMAMRTMYELRKLVNYLLGIGKIDIETKIVIEMARELNDTNKRWAIQTYQSARENENKEFAKAIIGVAKEKYPNINENDANNINKVRLWWEQLENGEEIYKKIKELKEDVEKFRLWKEQECQCIYTGSFIRLTDLFDGTSYDFEHTLPISKSFDNSLSNQTICSSFYNQKVKKNQLPTQLPNYSHDSDTYKAIAPRLEKWMIKVETLRQKIEKGRLAVKTAIRSGDTVRKNELIKQRHLDQITYDYWNKKLQTFTLTEMPNWWKNSQLVDTQIISKYAKSYLKSLFNRVDVQKGTVTAEFRNIFGIMGDEKKDRTKHSHHAIDAAVLTLIPNSAKREDILQKYYSAKENRITYQEKPYSTFNISHILRIGDDILVTHIAKDQTLSETKKKERVRGKIIFHQNADGSKTPVFKQGDSIRGQLHEESYLGAIKVNERNENGYVIKEKDKYVLKQRNDTDEIWIVSRKKIEAVNFEKDCIVDEILKKHLCNQIKQGVKATELRDFNNKLIRHIRCRVKAGIGFLSQEKALAIKMHTHKSKHLHKQNYLALNSENYIYLLYEHIGVGEKITRSYKILNRFDMASLKISNLNNLREEPEYQCLQKGKGKKATFLALKAILKVGDKVLLFNKHKDEINKSNLSGRLYKIYKFNEMSTTGYLYCQFHLEARPDKELGDGDTKFDPSKYQARLKLSADNFNCLIENIDFKMKNDGSITWLN